MVCNSFSFTVEEKPVTEKLQETSQVSVIDNGAPLTLLLKDSASLGGVRRMRLRSSMAISTTTAMPMGPTSWHGSGTPILATSQIGRTILA